MRLQIPAQRLDVTRWAAGGRRTARTHFGRRGCLPGSAQRWRSEVLCQSCAASLMSWGHHGAVLLGCSAQPPVARAGTCSVGIGGRSACASGPARPGSNASEEGLSNGASGDAGMAGRSPRARAREERSNATSRCRLVSRSSCSWAVRWKCAIACRTAPASSSLPRLIMVLTLPARAPERERWAWRGVAMAPRVRRVAHRAAPPRCPLSGQTRETSTDSGCRRT